MKGGMLAAQRRRWMGMVQMAAPRHKLSHVLLLWHPLVGGTPVLCCWVAC